MPRTSEVGIPVQQAVLTPIGVDLGPGGQGLQALGQTVSGVGREIERQKKVQQLLDEKMQNQIDIRARIRSGGIRTEGDAKIDALLASEPDPAEWEALVNKQFNESAAQLSKLDMSEDSMVIERARLEVDLANKLAATKGLATQRIAQDNRDAAEIDFLEALESGDAIKAAESEENLRAVLSDQVDPEEENDIITALEKKGEQAFAGTAVGVGFAAWESTVTSDKPEGDLNVAFDVIEAMDLPEGMKQEVETELKTRVMNRRAENKLQLEARQEADLGEINQLLYFDKDYDTAKKAIAASSLAQKSKALLFEDVERRAAAVVKGVPIPTVRSVFARLYEKGLGIWKRSVTKRDYDEDLATNSHKLSDEDFQELTKLGSTTLKSSQASALSQADKEAARLLVNHVDEPAYAKFLADSMRGMKPDVAKLFESEANEIRQLQFWNLSLYNKDLRQWIADNPEKLGKDFFQYAEGQKHVYWNKSIDEIRLMKTQRDEIRATLSQLQAESDLATREAFDVGPPLEVLQAPPVITTKEAYDKLPKGSRYVDSQGRMTVKR